MVLRPPRTKLGSHFSEGTRRLWVRIEKDGLELAQVAERIGMSRSGLWRVLVGDRRGGLDLATSVEREFGIASRLWTAEPEKPFQLPAARAA